MNKSLQIGIVIAMLVFGGALYYFYSEQGKFTHDNLRFSVKCSDEWKMLGASDLEEMDVTNAHMACIAPDNSTNVMLQVVNNKKNQTSKESFDELIWQAEQAGAPISDRHTKEINGKIIHFHTVQQDEIKQTIAIFATEEYVYLVFYSALENRFNAFYPGFEETLTNLYAW